MEFYSKKYHIVGTDDFTREYLESEGIQLDDKEVRRTLKKALILSNKLYS